MKPRIVFMGTPEFAVPSLEILLAAGYPVVGVITATDKLGGRGNKTLLESAVKKCAVRHGIPVLQPRNLKDEGFHAELRGLEAELQIVVAFRMLPAAVWEMPRLGTFNLHGSLLPKYRGAAPINWAVIQGEEETGCTTFFLQHEIDTGDVLLQRRIAIGPDETAGEVHDRMMLHGAELVLQTVALIESGNYQPSKQNDAAATPAPKLHRENTRIDFTQPAIQVHNFIRGLSPWPAAWTLLGGEQLKIIRTHCTPAVHQFPAGTLLAEGRSTLKVACPGGFVHILSLQLAGRKRMSSEEFLNGTTIGEGTVLGV
ncbi:methionyl-tRNA formyltransferase [Neolewinella lacunae]|uniref:Methionyl-tRNA formyltransferase n=1 Tax=Neolewinella lacunae TaxID=1517758 RepID=A0A923PLS9_9BACT|nr:methionyl-tRNA formyltransferase [Neolewinella lacunae]MBC6996518.1 methionyl-tRNA formyltransferase [Neolewinella lacunae]MDN3634917.1 methionyl-tRNA formyltransferase [Neolewinella lacunae]